MKPAATTRCDCPSCTALRALVARIGEHHSEDVCGEHGITRDGRCSLEIVGFVDLTPEERKRAEDYVARYGWCERTAARMALPVRLKGWKLHRSSGVRWSYDEGADPGGWS